MNFNKSNLTELQGNMLSLIDSMMQRKPVAVHHGGVMHVGVVNCIEAEDGSGNNYNITLNNQPAPFFVKLNGITKVWPVE